MSRSAKDIINFMLYAEKLKTEYRQAFKSDGLKESAADHSWSLSLLVILSAPNINKDLNFEKMIKMAIIHDLVEIDANDVPILEYLADFEREDRKTKDEVAALNGIKKRFGELGEEIAELWYEFEEKTSDEAIVVKALDKLDGQLQFLNDKKTSLYNEDQGLIQELLKQTTELCQIDPFLIELDKASITQRQKRVRE